jgi:catenin alpha
MAVIDAARRISEAGTQLDKLARQIADQCPESSTKKDLIAYLQRIALYCHQLNITSKVNSLIILVLYGLQTSKPQQAAAPFYLFLRAVLAGKTHFESWCIKVCGPYSTI